MKNKIVVIILSLMMITIIGTGLASAQDVAPPTVSKTAAPTDINVAGSGLNDETIITLTVTGAGDEWTTAIPIDVMLVIDRSGSMSGDKIIDAKSAANTFVDKMSVDDRVGLVSFATSASLDIGLTTNHDDVESEINALIASGNTAIGDGILQANTEFSSNGDVARPWAMVLLSDGKNNAGSDPLNAAVAANNLGITIYTIGLGSGADETLLTNIASETGGNYYFAPSGDDLEDIYNSIYQEIVHNTIPNYVDVIEVTQSYIINEGSFNINPDSVNTVGGITTITWNNIGMSDGNPDLSSDETVILTFKAKSDQCGTNLDVDVFGTAKVNYDDKDGNYAGSVDIPQAKINVNCPPDADAGDDRTIEQDNLDGTSVTLDGSGSSDPDDDPLTYEWTWTDGSAIGESPTISLPLGATTITLVVNDGAVDSDPDTVIITVQDTTPPEMILSDEQIVLWSPNHKYRTVEIADCCVISVTDICDADVDIDDVVITSVSSDEPENDPGTGDGNTVNDIIIKDSQTVDLRAERQGNGNGRVYTINFEVTDASGNTQTGSCTVWVVHDQMPNDIAIDDGASAGYTVYYP
jgi:Ca-activated chloride channel family protein